MILLRHIHDVSMKQALTAGVKIYTKLHPMKAGECMCMYTTLVSYKKSVMITAPNTKKSLVYITRNTEGKCTHTKHQ